MTSAMMDLSPVTVGRHELDDLSEKLHHSGVSSCALLIGPDGDETKLPDELFRLLRLVVDQLEAGNGVSVVPIKAELTTVQAAEILNVSRPFLIKRLEAGDLPFHMAGTHRRIFLADLLAYRDRRDKAAEEALARMSEEAEEFDLYE